MGLIDRLIQEEKQVVQTELAKKADDLAKQQITAKKLVEATDVAIGRNRFYLNQNILLMQLLDNLSKFGYIIDYLDDISGRAGARSSVLFTTVWSGDSIDTHNSGDDQYEKSAEMLGTSKVDLNKKIEEIGLFPVAPSYSSLTPYRNDMDNFPLLKDRFMAASTQFFGDPVYSYQGSWARLFGKRFTEPTETGIGFRFAKLIERVVDDSPIHTSTNIYGEHIILPNHAETERYSVFYIRIRSPHRAVITGSTTQEEVDIQDRTRFDQALERAYVQPFSPAFVLFESRLVEPSHEGEN